MSSNRDMHAADFLRSLTVSIHSRAGDKQMRAAANTGRVMVWTGFRNGFALIYTVNGFEVRIGILSYGGVP